MKVVAFNGSARKQGNTAILIKHLFTELEKEGIETELIELAGEKYRVASHATNASKIRTGMKALIERSGMTNGANDVMFKHKVGAAVIAVRRGGAIHAFDSINHFFLVSQMIVPGSSYWNMGLGKGIGDVDKDEEGIRTMINLGKNMAWLLKKIGSACLLYT